MLAGSRPSDSREVRKIGLLRTFTHPSRPDLMSNVVKIGPSCVVKWEKRNSRELQHALRAVAKRLPCWNFALR